MSALAHTKISDVDELKRRIKNECAYLKHTVILLLATFALEADISNMRRSEHFTDALISIHWLRVPERIVFKVATLTFRALHGTAPHYMMSKFTRVADMSNRRRLRSTSSNQLDVPYFYLPTVGSRAFPIAGAKVWNSLPDDVTSAPSM